MTGDTFGTDDPLANMRNTNKYDLWTNTLEAGDTWATTTDLSSPLTGRIM